MRDITLFNSLDFLYVPASDIETSVRYYTSVLGGRLAWKIHAFGVWVACVSISESSPHILLADHIDRKKDGIIMIYRVSSLDSAAAELGSRGWKQERSLEIPPGPCHVFHDPSGNTIAIYENVRPGVMKEFEGRIDKS
jgi:predicted enzyme related to lactoylglutathione lyase